MSKLFNCIFIYCILYTRTLYLLYHRQSQKGDRVLQKKSVVCANKFQYSRIVIMINENISFIPAD